MTTFTGNISKAAETRQVVVNGVPTFVTDFNVAENYPSANGENATQFYRISLWREKGTKLARYLTLGRLVGLEGRVRGRAYIDKNGKAQCQLEMSNPTVHLYGANKKTGELEVEIPETDGIITPEEETDQKPF